MPLDGRPALRRHMTDEEIDRVIMQGSPFAPPPAAARSGPASHRAMSLGEVLRALAALGLVFAAVAVAGALALV